MEELMKKLTVALIGQGRSGRNIHGKYFLSEANTLFNVKYVVDADEYRRGTAREAFEGCITLADYKELYAIDDIDLVVNASYSDDHYPLTKELLLHGFNVLCEKPLGATRRECDELIAIAKKKGVAFAAFQQTFYAPFFIFAYNLARSGKLGDIKQVDIKYNGFSRRWDWQTLQKRCAGSAYNTGPHPIGMALGFLDFDDNARAVFTRLESTPLVSGDAEDYAKLIITAPGKPVIDVEMSSMDAYSPYTLKLQGTKGSAKLTLKDYEMTYIVDGENPERPVKDFYFEDEERKPTYCSEKLIKHTESGEFDGTAFDIAVDRLYKELYELIVNGTPMHVVPEHAARIISIIEQAHAENPLPVRFPGGME